MHYGATSICDGIFQPWTYSQLDTLKVPQGSRHLKSQASSCSLNDTIDGTDIKFLVEDEEELEAVAEEEAGHDGDEEVCEVLFSPLAGRARCPEVNQVIL